MALEKVISEIKKSGKKTLITLAMVAAIAFTGGCGKNPMGVKIQEPASQTIQNELAEIIAQYNKSDEKILIRNYSNKNLGDVLKGGKLNIYSENKAQVYDRSFADDEAVEADAKQLAESSFDIVYGKGGKSYSTKLMIER